ncbi:MAG: iron-sulfur cluster assembly accessory protein, partial [Pseudomonadota bacterium]
MKQFSDPFADTDLKETNSQQSWLPMTLDQSAAKQINVLKKRENKPNAYLRIKVTGGGCAGYQYQFGWEENIAKDDQCFFLDEAGIVVDQRSMQFLSGCQLRYTDELIGSAFKIENPDAVSTCSCGTSFYFK